MEIMTQPKHVGKSTVLQFGPQNDWAPEEVREELGQILRDKLFVKSARLSSFLRTGVEYLLTGKAEQFKEYTVGVEVYGRPSSYDPNQDSIVRTEARRLRAKLNEYYSSNRSGTSIMILLEVGSYVPVITACTTSASDKPLALANSLPRTHHALNLAIYPFRARGGGSVAEQLASDLADELMHHLSQHERITLFSACPDAHLDPFEQLRIWNSSGVEFVLHGKVSLLHGEVTVNIQLTTLPGMILWSQRFEGNVLADLQSDLPPTILASVLNYTGATMRQSVVFN
jgi:TolB-like protein